MHLEEIHRERTRNGCLLNLWDYFQVFTMILVTLSVLVAIGVLNVHFRSPSTHLLHPWCRKVFIRVLPRILLMRSPQYTIETDDATRKQKDKAADIPSSSDAKPDPRETNHYPRCEVLMKRTE